MKVKLKVTTYIDGKLEKVNSIHDLKNGEELVDKGIAVEVEEDTPVDNETIIDGLSIEDDEKSYLIENIGDFNLGIKKDGTLNKKSEDKVNDILDGMNE